MRLKQILQVLISATSLVLQVLSEDIDLKVVDSHYEIESNGSYINVKILDKPMPLSTGNFNFNFLYGGDLQIHKIQFKLFDNLQINIPKITVQQQGSAEIEYPATYVNNFYSLELNLTQQAEFSLIIVSLKDVTNINNSNHTAGIFYLEIMGFSDSIQKAYVLGQVFYQEIDQCREISPKLLSNPGAHKKGVSKFSFDFSKNLILNKEDSLLFQFYTEKAGTSNILAYPPLPSITSKYPFDDIKEIEAQFQQVYQDQPQKVQTQIISEKSLIVKGMQYERINNSEGYINQELQFELSNIYPPPTTSSLLSFDVYIINKDGYFKCYSKHSFPQKTTSTFKKLEINYSSIEIGDSLILNIKITPQRYLLSKDNDLELEFSTNFNIPDISKIKVTSILNFKYDLTTFSITGQKMIFKNFLPNAVDSTSEIGFIIEGVRVPLFKGTAQITVRNIYKALYYQHETTHTQIIQKSGIFSVQFSEIQVQKKSTVSFYFITPIQLSNQGTLNVILPQTFFGILTNISNQSIKYSINSQEFSGVLTVENNTLNIPYTYATTISPSSTIKFEINNVLNYAKTNQIQDKLEYQIIDQSGESYLRSFTLPPIMDKGEIQITSWKYLLNNKILSPNNIELSFQVFTFSYGFDGMNQNSFQIKFSPLIQITKYTRLVFLDAFESTYENQISWNFDSGKLEVFNFTLMPNQIYTIRLLNINSPRHQTTFLTPQIGRLFFFLFLQSLRIIFIYLDTFGKSVPIHSILEGQSSLSILITEPYSIGQVEFTLIDSTLINYNENSAQFSVTLGNLNVLAGETIVVYLDKQIGISQLDSITIQSKSIQSIITLTKQNAQLSIDTIQDQRLNIISFKIPADLVEQEIKQNLQIILSKITNPIYKTSIQYRIQVKNLLEQPIIQSIDLYYNQLTLVKLTSATLTYNGKSDNKLLGNEFTGNLTFQSESYLPLKGKMRVSGFGKNIVINQSKLSLVSQQSFSVISSSIQFDNQNQVILFEYEDLKPGLNQIDIQINGLNTNHQSYNSTNELSLQVYDVDTGSQLVTFITPISALIADLQCDSKCVRCFINSTSCVEFVPINNNNNSTNGNNNNNNSTNGNNNNNNNSTNGNNNNNNNTNTNNNNNNNDQSDINQGCLKIIGCGKCDSVNSEVCLQCTSGYQLKDNDCFQIEQKFSIISVAILISFGIGMGSSLKSNRIRIQYLLLILWVTIEIYCYFDYLKETIPSIIFKLIKNENRKEVISSIAQVTIFTFIATFYLFSQLSFCIIRKSLQDSQKNKEKPSRIVYLFKLMLNTISLFEFRFFYALSIKDQRLQKINGEKSIQTSPIKNKSRDLSPISKSSSFILNTQGNQTSRQLSSNQLISNNNENNQAINQGILPYANRKQYIVFLFSLIQNSLKIAMISIDASSENVSNLKIKYIEMIVVSMLLFCLHIYIIRQSFKSYNGLARITPYNEKLNANNFNLQNEQQKLINNNQDNKQENKIPQSPLSIAQGVEFTQLKTLNSQRSNVIQLDRPSDQQNLETRKLEQTPPQRQQVRRKRTKISLITKNENINIFTNE